MHARWYPDRLRAVLAEIKALGYTDADIGRMGGITRPQANRWSRATSQPKYANIERLAHAIWHQREDLARELAAAAGYAGISEPSSEPEPPPPIPPDLVESVRRSPGLTDDDRQRVLDAIARTLSGQPEPPTRPGEAVASPGAARPGAAPGRREAG